MASSDNNNRDRYDYVIVGAGSAGCVLANRLTEDPDTTVLLLEAGGVDPFWEWKIRMPAALAYPMNGTRYSWDYHTEPEPHLGGRVVHCPRGRVLGGSSSINGMVYIRGNALDYDRWAREDSSLSEWDYRHCLPYFIKSETREDGGNDYHGDAGPLQVARGRGKNPLFGAFTDAALEAGYPYTEDMNGYQQEGFGPMDRTTGAGLRNSASVAYLRPVMRRPNLTVLTRASARRLIQDGQQVTGVEFARRKRICKVFADREVILSGGPINNPQLLMLSGIGNADQIKETGLTPTHHLPGVGENLQDHLEIYLQMECVPPVSIYKYYNLLGKAYVGARWMFTRTGLGASNQFEAGGFIRSRTGVEHPNLQYHFFPMAVRYDGKSPNDAHGFQAHVGSMRSQSKGWVRLRSSNPDDAPKICFNYMSKDEDWEEFRAAVRLTREIFAQPAFAPYRGVELSPGPDVRSDAEIDAYLRGAVESAFHPSCTCKMGSDEMSVVDADCKVRGLQGLRIADSSIMPSIVSGNLNAPTIMLAEKAADIIAGKDALQPSDAPVYVAKDYRDNQR
jgi:choline dehydrogenase